MKLKRKEYELVVKYIMDLQKQINELRNEVDTLDTKYKVLDYSVKNKQNKDISCIVNSSMLSHDLYKEAIEELEKKNKDKKLTDIDIAWKEDGDSDLINKAESV